MFELLLYTLPEPKRVAELLVAVIALIISIELAQEPDTTSKKSSAKKTFHFPVIGCDRSYNSERELLNHARDKHTGTNKQTLIRRCFRVLRNKRKFDIIRLWLLQARQIPIIRCAACAWMRSFRGNNSTGSATPGAANRSTHGFQSASSSRSDGSLHKSANQQASVTPTGTQI